MSSDVCNVLVVSCSLHLFHRCWKVPGKSSWPHRAESSRRWAESLIYSWGFTSLLKPWEQRMRGCEQRSGFALYCPGKENTLKNVSGPNDCQLLQRREDKTGRPLMVFLLAGITNSARKVLLKTPTVRPPPDAWLSLAGTLSSSIQSRLYMNSAGCRCCAGLSEVMCDPHRFAAETILSYCKSPELSKMEFLRCFSSEK